MTDIIVKSDGLDDYADLRKTFNYDKQRATRLAQAMTEAAELNKRVRQLNKILEDNRELQPFLWRTANDKVLALHDIEDDHLKNIIGHITRNGGLPTEQLTAEAESRGIDVEAESLPPTKMISHSAFDDDYYDDADRFGN